MIAYPRAGTRSWMEMNVRPWLAVTILMAVAGIVLGVYSLMQALEERRLIASGTSVVATVVNLGADTRQMPRDEPVRVTLEYVDPASGRTISSERLIHRVRGGVIKLKDRIDIRIDGKNPSLWTARTESPPILQSMTVPLMLMPIVMLSLIATWWQRGRVMQVLKTGTTVQATVSVVRQTPLAPMSRQIGVALPGHDRAIRYAYWPGRNGAIAKGDTVEMIHAATGPVLPRRSYE